MSGDESIPGVYNPNQSKYVYRSLYKNTKTAALQDSDKNKFLMRGRYKSSGSSGIPIGAYNVPRGSVKVTAGGRVLVEGVDYTVNYQTRNRPNFRPFSASIKHPDSGLG